MTLAVGGLNSGGKFLSSDSVTKRGIKHNEKFAYTHTVIRKLLKTVKSPKAKLYLDIRISDQDSRKAS